MLKDKIKIIINELPDIIPSVQVAREPGFASSLLAGPVSKAVTIIGPRRAGKTWFLFQLMTSLEQQGHSLHDFLYLNFEDERLLPFGAQDFQLVLDAWFELRGPDRKPFLFFDEIQNIDGWEKFIRRMIDQGFRVCITGSNSRLLSREIATALRGRTLTHEIFPFSFREYVRLKGVNPDPGLFFTKDRHLAVSFFDQYLHSGGYPEIVLTEVSRLQGMIAQDYFNTIFYRDLVERYRISNMDLMRHWMHMLLANISSRISFRKAENDFKLRGMPVSSSTIAKFSRYLEESYFGFFIEIHGDSVRKRQTNPKKFYLVDQGLHSFLDLGFSTNKGRLLENVVFLELRRQGDRLVRYYTTRAGHEIDFLIQGKGRPQLLQVCYNMDRLDTAEREKRAILKGMEELGLNEGIIITHNLKNELQVHGKLLRLIPAFEWLINEGVSG